MTDEHRVERLEAIVRGLVQGVGFRYFVLRLADRLDLTGWVANERDGTVRCVAEGPRASLERFLDALRSGPPAARVDDVGVMWTAGTGAFTAFGVRSGDHSGD
jgi:acylphosphatase